MSNEKWKILSLALIVFEANEKRQAGILSYITNAATNPYHRR